MSSSCPLFVPVPLREPLHRYAPVLQHGGEVFVREHSYQRLTSTHYYSGTVEALGEAFRTKTQQQLHSIHRSGTGRNAAFLRILFMHLNLFISSFPATKHTHTHPSLNVISGASGRYRWTGKAFGCCKNSSHSRRSRSR